MTDAAVEDVRLVLAKNLVEALENKNEVKANEILDEISGLRESILFQEVGRLTRELHDSMKNFASDSSILTLTESDIPDAKERLQYVIETTEKAAHKTIAVIEEINPILKSLIAETDNLSAQWDLLSTNESLQSNVETININVVNYFSQTRECLVRLETGLNDILLAQDFQDITGQIITRVINLVQSLESNMVGLVSLSSNKVKDTDELYLEGPVVPGVNDDKKNVAANQDEVDELLSSLGF